MFSIFNTNINSEVVIGNAENQAKKEKEKD